LCYSATRPTPANPCHQRILICKHFTCHLIKPPYDYFKITLRATQLRGDVKTKAKPLVESYFKLETAMSESGREAIRSKVQALLTKSAFIYKV
jgi:hypothetical protein